MYTKQLIKKKLVQSEVNSLERLNRFDIMTKSVKFIICNIATICILNIDEIKEIQTKIQIDRLKGSE